MTIQEALTGLKEIIEREKGYNLTPVQKAYVETVNLKMTGSRFYSTSCESCHYDKAVELFIILNKEVMAKKSNKAFNPETAELSEEMGKIELKQKRANVFRKFDFSHAERLLRMQNGSWEIPATSNYKFSLEHGIEPRANKEADNGTVETGNDK